MSLQYPTMESILTFVIFTIFCCFVAAMYWPSGKLFFRNDDWYYIRQIRTVTQLPLHMWAKAFFFNDSIPELGFIRHFHPLSLLLLASKYKLFKTDYRGHVFVSIGLHTACSAIIFLCVYTLTGSLPAAMVAAGMFAQNNILADTLFWAGQASFILMTLLCVGSVAVHPFHGPETVPGTGLFFLINFICPFVFEFGYLIIMMNMLLFFVPGELSLLANGASLILIGAIACWHLWLRHKKAGAPRHVQFVGVRQLILNVVFGLGKTFSGFWGMCYGIRVSDTLYIEKPRSAWPLLGILIGAGGFYKGMFSLTGQDVTILGILLFVAVMPYIVISFTMDHTNPNPDLAHQLPRYSYLPAGLIAISLGIIIGKAQISWWWALFFLGWGVVPNWNSVRFQLGEVKRHTDVLRQDVDRMRSGGAPPAPRARKRTHDYRLDWMFNEENIRSFLQLESDSN